MKPDTSSDPEKGSDVIVRSVNCPFCEEFSSGRLDCEDTTFTSRLLFETEHFAVVPDISPLVPGHVMILPKSHQRSFGAVPLEQSDEFSDLMTRVKRVLTECYEPPVILEHGTNSLSVGGGCVSHAHLHFMPRPVDFRPALREYGMSSISRFEDLRTWADQDRSYVFYTGVDGAMYVADQLFGIPRQFIRIEFARAIGLPDPLWNWREHILLENLESTFNTLSKASWK